jgi:hypothetical protein
MHSGAARAWAGGTLALLVAGAAPGASWSAVVSGLVRDATGTVVGEAEVSLLTSRQTVVRTVRGRRVLRASGIAPAATFWRLCSVGTAGGGGRRKDVPPLEVVLSKWGIRESDGLREHVHPRPSFPRRGVIDESAIARRAKAVVAQVANRGGFTSSGRAQPWRHLRACHRMSQRLRGQLPFSAIHGPWRREHLPGPRGAASLRVGSADTSAQCRSDALGGSHS